MRARPTISGISTGSTLSGVHSDLHDFVQTTDASCVDNVGRTNVNLLQVSDGNLYGVNGAYGSNSHRCDSAHAANEQQLALAPASVERGRGDCRCCFDLRDCLQRPTRRFVPRISGVSGTDCNRGARFFTYCESSAVEGWISGPH